jgi:hypothetical protein
VADCERRVETRHPRRVSGRSSGSGASHRVAVGNGEVSGVIGSEKWRAWLVSANQAELGQVLCMQVLIVWLTERVHT